MTFGRGSEKFPSMKTWIYICTIVLAAGMVTAPAQDTKTNTQTSATTSTLNTNGVAVPPPMAATPAPAPAVAKEVNPPVVAPLVETSTVPAQPEITAEPMTPTNAAAPSPESSGIGRKGVWAGGVAVLVVVGGLVIFMWWRSRTASQGSLITCALNEDQKKREDKNVPPPMT